MRQRFKGNSEKYSNKVNEFEEYGWKTEKKAK